MDTYPNKILVDVEWLKERLANSNLRILDVRGNDPRLPVGYRLGHIPGAIALNPGRDFFMFANGMMDVASPEKIAQSLAANGVSNDSTVVLYDETNDQLVAMVYWVLRYIGHRELKILHGGWTAWQQSGNAISRDTPAVTRADYRAQSNDELRATAEWIQSNSARPDLVLLDVRTEDEFVTGRIPGAINLPYDTSFDFRTMLFKDAATLRAQLESIGATPDKEIITYCHSGARSSHMFMTLQMMGYLRVRNYFGSMADWYEMRGLPIDY